MFAYWLLFALPALLVLSPWRGTPGLQRLARGCIGVLFPLMFGLRHQVGEDWVAYPRHCDVTLGVPLSEAIETSDPGYLEVIRGMTSA